MERTQTLAPAQIERPVYEKPAVRVMTEEEILNSFQVTQAMVGWWGGVISPCTC